MPTAEVRLGSVVSQDVLCALGLRSPYTRRCDRNRRHLVATDCEQLGTRSPQSVDHRGFRPPKFLESFRKWLGGKMRVGRSCSFAGLEVKGQRGLVLLRPSVLFPPDFTQVRSIIAVSQFPFPTRTASGTHGEYGSGSGREKGEGFVARAGRC